ncbi:4-alpha-glucanotransferase [Acidobacteria bacterium AH-259-A15]|nr:4-alpha-glucanotransferase [Acidobacteria bacterium AH-259-A15]
MKFGRCSGILLHVTSLPARLGIGDLGPEAYRFVDFLQSAGQQIWQVLPIGPIGHGNSPYQSFSAFAGNPLLISLEKLVEEGWLRRSDLKQAPLFPVHEVDYPEVIKFKLPLLHKACDNFLRKGSPSQKEDYESFCQQNRSWLEDFALFMAVKDASGGKVWTQWDHGIARREPAAISHWQSKLQKEVKSFEFQQYQFFKQWQGLRRYSGERNVQIMGDIPIFIAHNSADVWVNPKFFDVDEQGNPTHVAGVPPDYFSETGQRWGNPLYRWDILSEESYQWWIDRFEANLSCFDIIKLDHFRGFEAYWVIPVSEPSAANGRWLKGPGAELFDVLEQAMGELPIVAENLGFITPEVEALRKHCGCPGMAILQFAFGGHSHENSFLPHNYFRDLVVYTGTHDNDTTLGWWTRGVSRDSTSTQEEIKKEREFARQYLNTNGHEIHWAFIRAAVASVANIAIIPLQDLLGLGSEARMNVPGRAKGNWRWRYVPEMLRDDVRDRLKDLTETYGRRHC